MTEKRYFQISIFMPLLLPAVLCILNVVAELGAVFGYVHSVAYVSLVLAGTPYAVVATIAFVFLWARKIEAYYTAAKVAPLIFIPIFAAYIYITELLGRTSGSVSDVVSSIIWSAVLVLPIGYLYVAIVFLVGSWLFKSKSRS